MTFLKTLGLVALMGTLVALLGFGAVLTVILLVKWSGLG